MVRRQHIMGNNQVGKGGMEIIESSRPSAITIKSNSHQREGHNIAELTNFLKS